MTLLTRKGLAFPGIPYLAPDGFSEAVGFATSPIVPAPNDWNGCGSVPEIADDDPRWDFVRVIVGHGEVIEHDGKAKPRNALDARDFHSDESYHPAQMLFPDRFRNDPCAKSV